MQRFYIVLLFCLIFCASAFPQDRGVIQYDLTIRQGSAYLFRRTICHARCKERLEDHLDLFRCYYNFVRPHRALKFGREVRTPAMQAGLTTRRLSFREIFSATIHLGIAAKCHIRFHRFCLVSQCG
jgi:hypothetical protein